MTFSHNRKISRYVLMNCMSICFLILIVSSKSYIIIIWNAFQVKTTLEFLENFYFETWLLIQYFSWNKNLDINLEISRDISKNLEMRYDMWPFTFHEIWRRLGFSLESIDCFRIWPRLLNLRTPLKMIKEFECLHN